ncbi:MAG: ornithine cyclodeaminase family protein [Planctomycetes bacterium]|nr:ornithine cyclodeaminase family protein [Planctomycetota bacterium]
MKVLSLEDIKATLDLERPQNLERVIAAQEAGFVAFSKGQVVVPEVFYMPFDETRPGGLHVKGARVEHEEVYVVKLAAGCSDNQVRYGVSTSQGLMIVGSALTGEPLVLLQDEGYLTDLRTALAGHIAAKYLAPREINGIGILGSGGQARLQARYLRSLTPCRELHLWGRTRKRVRACAEDLARDGFTVEVASSPVEVAQRANIIVTTTAATAALLEAEHVRAGTHITAMGADAPGKQELAADIFGRAARCVVDSRSQCVHHGDSHYPVDLKLIPERDLVELGQVIDDANLRRPDQDAITVADLTGVGVQDLQIAVAAAAPWL